MTSNRTSVSGWSLVVAVNNERVLQNTLLSSPAIDAGCQIIMKRGFKCAGTAYNSGLADAEHDIVVFAHQDVYLPLNWFASLELALGKLSLINPGWGVLGSFGVTQSKPAEMRGYCYSTGIGQILGHPFSTPINAQSLDELVLIVRRSSGLHFDELLPGFHLYGTDICLLSKAEGLGSYIISAFCIHNSNGIARFPADFWRGWFYLRHKWRRFLPIKTPCTTITKSCFPVAYRLAREWKQSFSPRSLGSRCEDSASLYRGLSLIEPEILEIYTKDEPTESIGDHHD
jgi:hypothetical protein